MQFADAACPLWSVLAVRAVRPLWSVLAVRSVRRRRVPRVRGPCFDAAYRASVRRRRRSRLKRSWTSNIGSRRGWSGWRARAVVSPKSSSRAARRRTTTKILPNRRPRLRRGSYKIGRSFTGPRPSQDRVLHRTRTLSLTLGTPARTPGTTTRKSSWLLRVVVLLFASPRPERQELLRVVVLPGSCV